jgi:hypothetical protein
MYNAALLLSSKSARILVLVSLLEQRLHCHIQHTYPYAYACGTIWNQLEPVTELWTDLLQEHLTKYDQIMVPLEGSVSTNKMVLHIQCHCEFLVRFLYPYFGAQSLNFSVTRSEQMRGNLWDNFGTHNK